MPDAAPPALLIAAAFVVGSIPWGLLLTKWIADVDVRTVGSGNVGATNASRVLGRKWGFVVLLLDAAKGAVPVLVFPALAGRGGVEWMSVACGLAAVLGHVFSPFLRFKGGKGVATSIGAIAAMAPVAALAIFGVFAIVLFASGYMSLASVVAAAALAPSAYVFHRTPEFIAFAALVAALVVVRHRANLGRIAAGTEPRFLGKKHDKEPSRD
jgi:glycerol-3-phosphate acyltransferase PlsY